MNNTISIFNRFVCLRISQFSFATFKLPNFANILFPIHKYMFRFWENEWRKIIDKNLCILDVNFFDFHDLFLIRPLYLLSTSVVENLRNFVQIKLTSFSRSSIRIREEKTFLLGKESGRRIVRLMQTTR